MSEDSAAAQAGAVGTLPKVMNVDPDGEGRHFVESS